MWELWVYNKYFALGSEKWRAIIYSLVEWHIQNGENSVILKKIISILSNKDYEVSKFFSNFHKFESENYVYNSLLLLK